MHCINARKAERQRQAEAAGWVQRSTRAGSGGRGEGLGHVTWREVQGGRLSYCFTGTGLVLRATRQSTLDYGSRIKASKAQYLTWWIPGEEGQVPA